MKILKEIEKTEAKLKELKEKLNKETEKQEWLDIPELKICIEKNVHDKNKSWNDLRLSEREEELLTAEECIFLANSKYAPILKMDGSSSKDDFFIKQSFNLNRKNGYVARFVTESVAASLNCLEGQLFSNASLGVRFKRKLKEKK